MATAMACGERCSPAGDDSTKGDRSRDRESAVSKRNPRRIARHLLAQFCEPGLTVVNCAYA
jgi:hypothetical protein